MSTNYIFQKMRKVNNAVCLVYWDVSNQVYTYTLVTTKAALHGTYWPSASLWMGGFDDPEACFEDALRQVQDDDQDSE